METKVAIAHLLHDFMIEPAKSTPPTMTLDKTTGAMRPCQKLELKFTKRQH